MATNIIDILPLSYIIKPEPRKGKVGMGMVPKNNITLLARQHMMFEQFEFEHAAFEFKHLEYDMRVEIQK